MPKQSATNQAEAARQAINLRTLQRIDSNILSILEWASYVVLYTYTGGKWAKEGIEGSLFVFGRSVTPQYGFLILNRNGMNNFIRPIISTTDLDVQEQFIHTSGEGMPGLPAVNEEAVHGLWFHGGPSEAERISRKMHELQAASYAPGGGLPSTARATVEGGPGVLSMSDLLGKLSAGTQSPQATAAVPSGLAAQASSTPSSSSGPLADLILPTGLRTDPDAASFALKSLLGLPIVTQQTVQPNGALDPPLPSHPLNPSPMDDTQTRLTFMPLSPSVSPYPQPPPIPGGRPSSISSGPLDQDPHQQPPLSVKHAMSSTRPFPLLNGSQRSYAIPPHMQPQVVPGRVTILANTSTIPSGADIPLSGEQRYNDIRPPDLRDKAKHLPEQNHDFPPLGTKAELRPYGHPPTTSSQPPTTQRPSSSSSTQPIPLVPRIPSNPFPPPSPGTLQTPTRGQTVRRQPIPRRTPVPAAPETTQTTPLGPGSMFPFMPAVLSTKSPTPKKAGLNGTMPNMANIMTKDETSRAGAENATVVPIDKDTISRVLREKLSSGMSGQVIERSGQPNGMDEDFRMKVREIWREDEEDLCRMLYEAAKAGLGG